MLCVSYQPQSVRKFSQLLEGLEDGVSEGSAEGDSDGDSDGIDEGCSCYKRKKSFS